VGVLAKVGRGKDALELLPHQLLACPVMPAPRAERLDEARRCCGIDRVERDDLVGEKLITGPARVVKAHSVALGKSANQRTHPVWVLALEGGVQCQLADAVCGSR